MANNDLKISEMPLVDGVVEGDVVPAVHNGENVAIMGKFFDDLANGMVGLGDDMNATNASVAALQGEVAGKQDALTTSADLSISSDNELSLTDMAKKRLFIDIWNTACGAYGQYNATTGFFELNGLTDITYEEALKIDSFGAMTGNIDRRYSGTLGVRTFYPLRKANIQISCTEAFILNTNVEVINGAQIKTSDLTDAFSNCTNLRSIQEIDIIGHPIGANTFKNCSKLENLKIYRVRANFNVQWSPKLTSSSFLFIINNAINESAITITVHPDVYAKLTDETNTEWHAVLTAAAAKNISFATA